MNYLALIKEVGPKKKVVSFEVLANTAVKIQAVVRGFLARKATAELKALGALNLRDDIKNMGKDKIGGAK